MVITIFFIKGGIKMERLSYKKLKEILNRCEIFHKVDGSLECFSGYYHISVQGYKIIVEEYPKRVWEEWCLFRSGVRIGMDLK